MDEAEKKARKQLYNQLDITPIVIISQAVNHCQNGSEITGLAVPLDFDRFYIHLQGPSTAEFEIFQGKIHLQENKTSVD